MRLSQRSLGTALLAAGMVLMVGLAATAAAVPSPQDHALRIQVKRMQRSFAAGQVQLLRVSAELKAGRASLAGLERSVVRDRAALADQVVTAYESGSEGLPSKLAQRLAGRVLAARSAVACEAVALGALATRLPGLAQKVTAERRLLVSAKSRLAHASPSATAAEEVADAHPVRAAAPSPAVPTGIAFPIARGDSAPLATWSVGAEGVDIAAPAGTPELAVCAGTVVLHGIGGLGPSTPVLHCDQPIGGADSDYVYYGYAGPNRLAPIGTHLDAGQVTGTVGAGIIGTSTGPALQIGFADSSGTPLPSPGAKLMALLRAAYRG